MGFQLFISPSGLNDFVLLADGVFGWRVWSGECEFGSCCGDGCADNVLEFDCPNANQTFVAGGTCEYDCGRCCQANTCVETVATKCTTAFDVGQTCADEGSECGSCCGGTAQTCSDNQFPARCGAASFIEAGNCTVDCGACCHNSQCRMFPATSIAGLCPGDYGVGVNCPDACGSCCIKGESCDDALYVDSCTAGVFLPEAQCSVDCVEILQNLNLTIEIDIEVEARKRDVKTSSFWTSSEETSSSISSSSSSSDDDDDVTFVITVSNDNSTNPLQSVTDFENLVFEVRVVLPEGAKVEALVAITEGDSFVATHFDKTEDSSVFGGVWRVDALPEGDVAKLAGRIAVKGDVNGYVYVSARLVSSTPTAEGDLEGVEQFLLGDEPVHFE